MLSSWRELGRIVFGKQRSERKQKQKRGAAELARAAQCVVESLEQRQLLTITLPATPATLPLPNVTTHVDISGGDQNTRHNTPSVAYNPLNPNDLAAVWVLNNPGANGRQKTFIQGGYSTDGGVTWGTFNLPGNLINPAIAPPAQRTLEQATDPTVAFDRLGQFYVTYSEHDADYSAGRIILQKFDFSGGAPVLDADIRNISLYHWVGADPVYHPTMAVDSNIATFTDPTTDEIVTDATIDPLTGQGPIYVAWSTDETPPPNFQGFNPTSIEIVASSDGGATFSPTRYVSDGDFTAGTRNITPRLVISQGTMVDPTDPDATPRVQPGQVGIVWDDFFSQRSDNVDVIWFDRIEDGGGAYFFGGGGGNLDDALPRPPNNKMTSTFVDTVTMQPGMDITDLNVQLTLRHPDLSQISVTLFDPNGVPIPLVLNRQDDFVQQLGQGITGANLTDTVFDQEAPANITAGTAPFTGFWIPEAGDLSQYYPATGGALLDGDWTLVVVDFVAGPPPAAPPPPPLPNAVLSWSLNFGHNIRSGLLNQRIPPVGTGGSGIPANDTRLSQVTFAGASLGDVMTDVNVHLTLTHPAAEELAITLIGPNGTRIPLAIAPGGVGAGQDYTGTIFDDQALALIRNATAPHTGRFQPESPLSVLNGISPNGTWGLEIVDTKTEQVGTLVEWSLEITTQSFAGDPGLIIDATPNPILYIPVETEFTATVALPDGKTITDLDVLLTLRHPDLSQLRVDLISPLGDVVPLFLNGLNDSGAAINPARGLSSADLGWLNGGDVGTDFDMETPRSIRNGTAPYLVHFRPEFGDLTQFYGQDGTTLNGDWILRVTDFVVGPDLTQGQATAVVSWGLNFATGLTTEADVVVTTSGVRGSAGAATGGAFPLTTAAQPDRGIAAAPTLASDNTLGSFSPYQGRLYITYVGKGSDTNDDTDVFLAVSDDGGQIWLPQLAVNDDRRVPNGFSGLDRSQFMPEVAVDQGTGTLVVSWLDARYDPSRARVATFVSSSLDGGASWSKQTYTNQPNSALDVAEATVVNIEPIPDNSSGANGQRDTDFGVGLRQGLTVVNGRINTVWAGNLNGAHYLNGGNRNDTSFHIMGAVAFIPAGPRVRDSEMGPVTAPQFVTGPLDAFLYDTFRAPDGTVMLDGFVVVFDRPIDPASFSAEDVILIYRDVHTPGTDPGTLIEIGEIEPIDFDIFGPAEAEGATTFLVHLLEPQSAVGTYSYTIGPEINDRIRHVTTAVVPTGTSHFDASGTAVNLVIPRAGTGGSGNPNNDTTNSTLTVSGITPGEVINDVNVTIDLTHTFDSDLIITLISPAGTRITLSNRRGFFDDDFAGTVFDDQATVPISAGFAPFDDVFSPDQPLARLFGQDPNGVWRLEIRDVAAIDVGELLAWSLDIETGTLQTIAIDGNMMDQNGDAVPGEGASPASMGDVYSAPRPVNDSAFNGDFVAAPFTQNTRPLIIPGPHIVQTAVTQQFLASGNQINLPIPPSLEGGSGDPLLDVTESTINISAPGVNIGHLSLNLSLLHDFDSDLIITLIAPGGGEILLSDSQGADGQNFINTTFDDNAPTFIGDGVAPFTGSFQPEDFLDALTGTPLSGIWRLRIEDAALTHTGTLLGWSLINSTVGDNLALNRTVNSLDVMFDRDMDSATITPATIMRIAGPQGLLNGPERFISPDPLKVIPDTTKTTYTFAVHDDFIIGDLDVQFDITHARTSDLAIVLIAPDGTRVPLVSNLGAGGNFRNILLDDSSLIAITAGANPFTAFGGYRPASALSALNGKNMRGTWKLEITDSTVGLSGTLNSWSLIATPAAANFTITPNPLGTDPDATHPRTYRIGFPTQEQTGTYAFQFAPTITSAAGDRLDSNLDAGVDMLYDKPSSTVAVTYNNNVTATIGGATANRITTSKISVSESYPVSGATVQVNITYPFDPDLTATLIAPFNDPLTGQPMRITLFSNVGTAGTRRNFTNTIFDDTATTPIQNGGGPFFGRFNPQLPLGNLDDNLTEGVWTLEINDTAAGRVGTLNSWSITFQKPVPSTGLGDPGVDPATASFRIFAMDPSNPNSHNQWTPVGAASNNAQGNSGRIGGLAVDPSDPSGNTVYVAGASGGVWKTTNFMTPDLSGPIWIPLTDTTPTFGINIGGIAVFGRSHDTTQSVVFVATGEGDTASPTARSASGSSGIGFLRSMDGGATWILLDSTTNVDNAGNPLPINSPLRDHIFVGTAGFKVVVDPKPTPTGGVIVYAALTGANGGIWRTVDSGNHWQLMRAGDATDVVLDYNSGYFNAFSNPTGNLQNLYAAFRGEGVFLSPNRGVLWNQMLGGVGDPLIQDNTGRTTAVPVNPPDRNPNGAKGRIVLANAALTGDPVRDLQYQGWLYALVVGTNDHVDGLYLTKDFGQNWTRIRLATVPAGGRPISGVATNDTSMPDYDVAGGGDFAQGNYDIAIGIDPNNPNIVYLGGTADGQASGLIRVDTTGIADPHAFFVSHSRLDGGNQFRQITDSISVQQGNPFPTDGGFFPNPWFNPMMNLVRNPAAPFVAASTINVINAGTFANSGAGAKWIPFDIEGTDHHRWVTMVDPVTGLTRLIVGDDQGLFTAVDDHGEFNLGIGMTGYGFTDFSRNGNLQVTQFYYGAAQPSNLAAQIAGAMFYGQAQDNGSVLSSPFVLDDGNIIWSGPEGDGAGIATDSTGSGTLYVYNWPCCGGNLTDFFQVNGVGRTFGLLQDSQAGNTPDPQWPFLGGSTFAVNPINGDQIIMSSQAGRIFGTANQGRTWFAIAEPTILDGTYAPAVAFGSPDPNGPGGADATNFFLYAGTSGGHIYVTFTGGGNQWTDISAGLDGSGVQMIVTNPLRGSHEAYAVTSRGIFHMADSSIANPTWVNITSNVFALTINPFGDPTLAVTRAKNLTSIQADWRYVIHDNLTDPTSPTHPVLYVGGEGGVYRSLDNGNTWRLFPDPEIDGARSPGGYLPNAHVTDLDMSLGNIDPTTGRALGVPGDPDVLLASTYGRSSFAIRLSPLIIPGTIAMTPSSGVITNNVAPVFTGLSAQTAFGNHVRISIVDLTDLLNPVIVGGFDGTFGDGTDIPANWTDADGNFSVQLNPGAFAVSGVRTIGIHASDDSGTTGNDILFTVTVDTTPAIIGTGGFNITGVEGTDTGNVTVATFSDPGPAQPLSAYSALIDWGDGTTPSAGTITFDNVNLIYVVTGSHAFANPGPFVITTQITRGVSTTPVTSAATVSNPAVIATGGLTFSAGRGVASTGVVAKFTDPGGPEPVSAYVATIDWGDGTATSTGVITFNTGTGEYIVSGTHIYANAGTFTDGITVTIAHTTAPSVQVQSTAVVALPGATVTGGKTFTSLEGALSSVQAVATFVDPNGAGTGTYSADIDWGDGTLTSSGTITQSGLTFTVSGQHRYTEEGSYVITVTVHRAGTSDGVGISTANVSDVSVIGTGGFTYNAPRGILGGVQTVATFVDPGGPEPLNEYSATIAWGDGQTSAGTITFNSATGVFSVTGAHLYALDGAPTIVITISHGTAANTVVTSTATVKHPPLVITGGFTFNAVEGQNAVSQTVATFIDPLLEVTPLSSFSATINWGDGSSSAGLVSLDKVTLVYSVNGAHKYLEEGNSYVITVTVTHSTADPAQTTSTGVVLDPAVVPGTAINFTGVEGTAISGVVATFTDPGGVEPLSDYSATISWGDGSSSAGTITLNGSTFSISGNHTYSTDAIYSIQTTIHHDTAPDAQAQATATINNAAVNATGGVVIAVVEGASTGDQVLATFTDPGTPEAPSAYSANIDWGDGSTSTGTIALNAGIFSVSGAHTYAKKGAFTIKITIDHGSAPDRTVNSTANVSDAPITVTANNLSVAEGVAFNGAVGAFVDANPLSVVGNFTATINWGDGTAASSGTISVDPLNSSRFIVNGTHTYAEGPATRTITLTIRDTIDAQNTAKTSTAAVSNSKPTVTISAPSRIYRGFAATFAMHATDSPADTSAGFKYVINWGDGTANQTIGAKAGNTNRNVNHTFASNGTFNVTVRATDRNNLQSDAVTIPVTVVTPPRLLSSSINGGARQRSRIMNVAFTLSLDAGISKGKLKLTRSGTNVPLTNATFSWNGGTASGNLGLSSLNLLDGNYRLAIDTGGGVLNVDFFRLAGDANGDRRVNATDLNIVNAALGKSTGQTGFNVNADLNVDGRVNNADKTIVNKNNGHTLPAP